MGFFHKRMAITQGVEFRTIIHPRRKIMMMNNFKVLRIKIMTNPSISP